MAKMDIEITLNTLSVRKALSNWLGDVINAISNDKPTVEEILEELAGIKDEIDEEIAVAEVNNIINNRTL
jgi:hypothetical protein